MVWSKKCGLWVSDMKSWFEVPISRLSRAQVAPYCMYQGQWVRLIDFPSAAHAIGVPANSPGWGTFCYRVYKTLRCVGVFLIRILEIWGLASVPVGRTPHLMDIHLVKKLAMLKALLQLE